MKTLLLLATTTLLATAASASASSVLAISQVYGGGGNAGATYTNDFIEIVNRSPSAVSLNGYSVQYASATGTSWQVTNLSSFSLQPGQYYLIQEASGGAVGSSLPTPNATGTINMSATAGKVALVSSTTALSGGSPTSSSILDFVGFGTTADFFEGTGPAPAGSNANSIFRRGSGLTDTDNNANDFAAGVALARNSSTAAVTPLPSAVWGGLGLLPLLVFFRHRFSTLARA